MRTEGPLRDLFRPCTLDRFLACDFQRRPTRLPHENLREVSHLVSHEEVDRVLWSGGSDLALRATRQSSQGASEFFDRPRSDLRSWLLEGYGKGMGIVITHAHGLFPSLALLSRAAEIEFNGRCSTKIVLLPKSVSASFDDLTASETFVVQVRGNQIARLSEPHRGSPLDRQLRPSKRTPGGAIELEQGDLLYVPGGTSFQLRPSGGDSLHVQLHIEIYRWLNLLEDMIEAAARESVALRKCVGTQPSGEAIGSLFDQLFERTDHLVSSAASLRQRRRVAESAPLPGSLLTEPAQLMAGDAWVEVIDNSLCHLDSAGDQVTLEFAARRSARVSGPAFIAPALAFIANSRRPFRIADLPGLSSLEEKLILVNRLIAEGLLKAWEPQ